MVFVPLCIVIRVEEAISISQSLLASCSHSKKGFSAGIGCKLQWSMTLFYLNGYFCVSCWGAAAVLEQQQLSLASRWWGLCCKTCRQVTTSSATIFQQKRRPRARSGV